MLESHLCARCGTELRHVAAPPDPVYALPVCVCPSCGLACVRRKHRMRTFPLAFRRLDRAFNLLALAAVIVTVSAGTSLALAIFMAHASAQRSAGPFVAAYQSIRSAPPEELLSMGLILASVSLIVAISGVLLGRVLHHWPTGRLIASWALLLLMLSLTPMLGPIVDEDFAALRRDITRIWPSRLEALAACWCVTALGVLLDRWTARPAGTRPNRRLRRSLKWARKNIARRRAG